MTRTCDTCDRDALKARLAELESLLATRNADAERYRWLRDGCDHKSHIANHIVSRYYGMEWDKKIDAARSAERTEAGK